MHACMHATLAFAHVHLAPSNGSTGKSQLPQRMRYVGLFDDVKLSGESSSTPHTRVPSFRESRLKRFVNAMLALSRLRAGGLMAKQFHFAMTVSFGVHGYYPTSFYHSILQASVDGLARRWAFEEVFVFRQGSGLFFQSELYDSIVSQHDRDTPKLLQRSGRAFGRLVFPMRHAYRMPYYRMACGSSSPGTMSRPSWTVATYSF